MKIKYQFSNNQTFKDDDLQRIYNNIFSETNNRKWTSYGEFILKIRLGQIQSLSSSLLKYVFRNLV